jgi:hypothetical protein
LPSLKCPSNFDPSGYNKTPRPCWRSFDQSPWYLDTHMCLHGSIKLGIHWILLLDLVVVILSTDIRLLIH